MRKIFFEEFQSSKVPNVNYGTCEFFGTLNLSVRSEGLRPPAEMDD